MIEAIQIGNKTINMKATANTPRKYRALFNKDLIVEMGAFMAHLDKKTGEFDSHVDFGFIERLAYTMASQCEDVAFMFIVLFPIWIASIMLGLLY